MPLRPQLLIAWTLAACQAPPLPVKPPDPDAGEASETGGEGVGEGGEGEGEGAGGEGEGEGEGPAGFGVACDSNQDCASELCAVTAGGAGRCTVGCVPDGPDTCPEGWHCTIVEFGGVDESIRPACWPGATDRLCETCGSDEDCGGGGSACVAHQTGGAWCGRPCVPEAEGTCPAGFLCRQGQGPASPQCVPEHGGCCGPGRPGAAETCNGADDNCNGATDEGFDVGQACSAGDGICRRDGNLACTADGQGAECDARPLQPLDHELCGNQQDDNCNGEVDEGFNVGESCAVGRGACERPGQYICSTDRTGTVCNVQPGNSEPERCGNDVDDDCDGETDEMLADPQALAACQPVGECEAAHLECDPGDAGGTVCVQDGGQPEVCNDKDDDCNGVTDEMLPDPERVLACRPVGECQFTHLECDPDDERSTLCVQEGVTEETCNQADDDCDGFEDEEFPTLGEACHDGLGVCRQSGSIICTIDGQGTTCNARAEWPDVCHWLPGGVCPELCDYPLDEDCDGVTDEADCTNCPLPQGCNF